MDEQKLKQEYLESIQSAGFMKTLKGSNPALYAILQTAFDGSRVMDVLYSQHGTPISVVHRDENGEAQHTAIGYYINTLADGTEVSTLTRAQKRDGRDELVATYQGSYESIDENNAARVCAQ